MTFDPFEATSRDPYTAARDPYEMITRDPLEETAPDPVDRTPRISRARRRAIEVCALIVLAPALLAVGWVDDKHQASHYEPQEHVTVVPHGGTGTLGHLQLKVAGRDATAGTRSSSGAVVLTLIVELRPLDAQGAKDSQSVTYTVRDRDGHSWSAAGLPSGDHDPAVGATTQVKVTASVPQRLFSSVVLEARAGTQARAAGNVRVLRFAH
jgi:hypothetical protein